VHDTALEFGKLFFETYIDKSKNINIVDVGSLNVNGTLRTVAPKDANYLGVDIEPGKGVDLVMTDPYLIPLGNNYADVVVSTSCFEHSEFFWITFNEICRILKKDGFIYLNTPSNGFFHQYPRDYYRFYPDSGFALQNWARKSGYEVTLIEAFIGKQKAEKWNDFVGIYLKSSSVIELNKIKEKRITKKISNFDNGYSYGEKTILNYSHLSEDQKLIDLKDNKIVKANEYINSKEQEIVNLTQVTQAKEQEIVNLTQVTQAKEQEIVNLTQVTQAKEREINEILNSFCWKITYPYRFTMNKFKKIKSYTLKFIFYLKLNGLKKTFFKVFNFIFKKKNINNKVFNFIFKKKNINNYDNLIKNISQKKINFPFYSKPLVSIIICVYGKIDYTLNCLKSILEAKVKLSYEIIIIDDCSPDLTHKELKKINNIKLYKNSENLGFIKSCNFAAKKAIGEYLVFLNNDTLVTENWLEELYLTFSNFNKVGLVGSKLIYPNGALQEAGGIIFKDASGWNYGNGQDKDHIDYNYARDVDYCSGASIMILKKIFEDLGGFDEYYLPAYYEDTDLAFKVRKKGFRVIYQPLSEVIHYEGVTSGKDLNSGVKKYQLINQNKFFTRYQNSLNHHFNNGENLQLAIDKFSHKSVLVVDTTTPTPDRDSGSIDTFNKLMFLKNYGFKVTFIPLHNFAKINGYTKNLQKIGIKCVYHPYFNKDNIKNFFKNPNNSFDLILVNREENFNTFHSLKKKYFLNSKLWLHNVDLNFIRLTRQARVEKNFQLIKYAKKIKLSEILNNKNADISTVVSNFEKDYFQKKKIQCELLPLFREKNKEKIKTFKQRQGIVFVAGFNHLPNQDALVYFLDEILPLLNKSLPDVKFSVLGNNLPNKLKKKIYENRNCNYFENLSNIELDNTLNEHKIGIAPLRYGAGIKGKIVTYIANDLPFIASNIALEGMNISNQKQFLYNSNLDFVQKIIQLYTDEDLYSKVKKEISILYDQNFSEEIYTSRFKYILKKLGFVDNNHGTQIMNYNQKIIDELNNYNSCTNVHDLPN
jgi:GT2 family glycosyltransferase/SAM-dependent methyltransferase